MGGVDLADMMIALYRTPAKSHRWYLAIFWQMVDIAVNNAWLLHRRDAAQLDQKHHCLKDFRLDVAKGLIYPEKQKKGSPLQRKRRQHTTKSNQTAKSPQACG